MQFRLTPFAPVPAIQELIATFEWDVEISCEWIIRGDIQAIEWPQPDSQPRRLDHLWRSTCFECFVGPLNQTRYMEFNVSPSGHWNAYSFTDEREGMIEAVMTSEPRTSVEVSSEGARVHTQFLVADPPSACRLGLSAVIRSCAAKTHYFALQHRTPRPDFHSPLNHVVFSAAGGQ